MPTRSFVAALLIAGLLSGPVTVPTAEAARERVAGERGASSGDYAAKRLLKRAEELLEAGEDERGVKMLETIIEQYSTGLIRYKALLALGRHYHSVNEQAKAIENLRRIQRLKKPDEEIKGDEKDVYLEALYLEGVCNFDMRQYSTAFAVLRKITAGYPNTVWANQAYFYIGMSHFAQAHWKKAIKALSMVGTFVDPDSPALEYVEAGHRFHVKITDLDLPILHRMGRTIVVEAECKSGDKETIVCLPLGGNDDIFMGSVLTETGAAVPGDGKLQVVGGDSIHVRYLDDNTNAGEKDVPREKEVKVVSTGSIMYSLGTYETGSKPHAAFFDQPLSIRLQDVDLDRIPGADTYTIRVMSRYRIVEEEDDTSATPGRTVDLEKLLAEDEAEKYKIRDEVTFTLKEMGDAPVHSGVLVGDLPIREARPGDQINQTDEFLSCTLQDEIVTTYVDELHAGGTDPIEHLIRIGVAGVLDTSPRAAQNVVPDPVLKAKKELVEAEAYLELARIFKSMGLKKITKVKAQEGLDRVRFTIGTDSPLPPALKEHAFQLMWELHLVQDDFDSAMATCQIFNKLYPESPLVSQALMGIGKVFLEQQMFQEAISALSQVLNLSHSYAKAEAQFMIAQVIEQEAEERAAKDPRMVAKGGAGISEEAIRQYRRCAQKYPDSPFAGQSLGKVVDYHISTRDYAAADDLLGQIFLDYEDESFLDAMLLKWVMVAYRMGNIQKAHEKCSQLIFEYPGSKYAPKATALLEKIDKKLGRSTEDAG